MARAGEVVAEALEVSRLKEHVLTQQARTISKAAGLALDAIRSGRGLHFLGDAPNLSLAGYLADLFFRGGGRQALPARPLLGPGVADPARAVGALVRRGDVLVALSTADAPGLERALRLARTRGATSLALVTRDAAGALSADLSVVVPTGRSLVAAEAFVAVGHVLFGLVQHGLGAAEADPEDSSLGVPLPPDLKDSMAEIDVIDVDPRGGLESDVDAETEEEALLADAVERLSPPPTKLQTGRSRRPPPPKPTPTPTPSPPAPRPGPAGGKQPSKKGQKRRKGVFRFRCGRCEEAVTVEERFVGRRGQCPHCLVEFIIPRPDEELDTTQRAAVVPGGAKPAPPRSGVPPTSPRPSQGRKERRRATRVTVRDAQVRWAKDRFPGDQRYFAPHGLEDVSLTGLCFQTPPKELRVGEVVFLSVDFPAFAEPVRAKAQVRRVQKAREGDGSAVGVRFVQYVADAEAKVRRLIDTPQLRNIRRR